MLDTNLQHIESAKEFNELINSKENVMVCCGRMGPMCIPVYGVMEEIRSEYPHVEFRDMAFDSAHAHVIKNLQACKWFRGLPFTVYFKNGKVAEATSSIQTEAQIRDILAKVF